MLNQQDDEDEGIPRNGISVYLSLLLKFSGSPQKFEKSIEMFTKVPSSTMIQFLPLIIDTKGMFFYSCKCAEILLDFGYIPDFRIFIKILLIGIWKQIKRNTLKKHYR